MPHKTVVRLLLVGPLPISTDVLGGTKVSFAMLVERFLASESFRVRVINTSRGLSGHGRVFVYLLNLWTLLQTAWRVYRETRDSDLVMFNVSSRGAMLGGPLIWLATKSRSRPLMIRLFGGDFADVYDRASPGLRWLADRTFLQSERLLLQTNPLCERFRHHPGTRWFPTTRDMVPASPASARQPADRCQRFLFLSQIRMDKGVGEALEAAERLPEGCGLTMYGAPVLDMDMSLLSRYQRTQYGGELPVEDVRQAFAEHDAFVFPAYCATEGMPGVILEALQCGLPVIAARWRFVPEIVQEGVSGLLVEPQSADDLTRAMNRLANDPVLFRKLSVGARRCGEAYRSGVWQRRLESWCCELVVATSMASPSDHPRKAT